MKDSTNGRRLVVVSNRLPVNLKQDDGKWISVPSTGGLATSMNRLLEERGGVWVGWSGDSSGISDPERDKILEEWRRDHNYYTVDLPPEIANPFYEGYSNETLWPLCHQFPTLFRFSPEDWKAYQDANERFRDEVLRRVQPGDLVWIHDYHLMLLPRLLREAAPDLAVGFFLHIPFPASDVFRLLPRADELLEGLLGADYIAFHTHGHLRNFRAALLRILGQRTEMDGVDLGARRVSLEALPIGIDPENFLKPLHEDEAARQQLQRLRARYSNQKLLLAVDRLDYTKGIPERLRAYQRFLTDYPEFRGKVVFTQVAVPSRERIPAFQDLSQETDELVGRINGKWSTPDWSPVVYLKRSLPHHELVALYAAADVAVVTPLIDGMNLVAKEFVACKEGQGGVLVLSEFAGVAAEMPEALRVNPYDQERCAEAIARALEMGDEEKHDRAEALYRRVVRNDVFKWGERFVSALTEAASEREMRGGQQRVEVPVDRVSDAYRRATSRLLLLDYDGTLVGYHARPQDAQPSARLRELLTALAADPSNTTVLCSGRRSGDLQQWFGSIPNLYLTAEHGGMLRRPGEDWESLRPGTGEEWKERVLPVFEHFTDRAPGSHIEEKGLSLVWHYRNVDPEFGEWIANELVSNLESSLADTELIATHGKKIVEVKFLWAKKSEVFHHLVDDETDFVLGVGDDLTDEDLFGSLPTDAWTIKVGPGNSRAAYRLSSYEGVLDLLERLARAGRQAIVERHAPPGLEGRV